MKKLFLLIFMVIPAVMNVNVALAENNLAEKKVVVISGISQAKADAAGYTEAYEGINKGFKSIGITPHYEWAELTPDNDKNNHTIGDEMVTRVKAMKPDLVIALSDDCLHYVGLKFKEIPVVFAYVFGDPTKIPGLPQKNITGVVRRSYAGDIFALANKLLGVKTVALIGKYSEAMAGVKGYMAAGADKLEAATGVRYLDMYLVNTFEEWTNAVKTTPAELLYLTDTSRLIKGDRELTRTETTSWTVENAKVPVIAAIEGDVEAGALFAILTSVTVNGEMAAELAVKILSGTAPSDIPYSPSTKGRLVFNATTAKKLNVNIPYEILSTAEKIYE